LETLTEHAAVPLHWGFFFEDLVRLLTTELGAPIGSGLETVRLVQEALPPARGRRFPMTLELPHDYAAWHGQIIEAKERGELEWTGSVPPLESFGPGSLAISDPNGVCEAAIGGNVDGWCGDNWELDSSISRTALRFRRI
jgi:hypothetical protein